MWQSKRLEGTRDLIDDLLIQPGCPSDHVDGLAPLDLFGSFIPDLLILDHIVTHTNVKIGELRSTIGKTNRSKSTYKDTSLKEMKCFIGFLVMTGAWKDCTLKTEEIFSPFYGCEFYKCLFSKEI